MTSKKAFHQFVCGMADLLESGLPVRQALETVSRSRKTTKCGRLSEGILRLVLEGYPLSSALQLNPVLAVDRQSVSVIAAAEKTGSLASAFRFIMSGEDQKAETARRLMEVSLYPALVLCVAGMGTAVLLKQYRLYSFEGVPEGALESCIWAGAFLLCYLTAFCFVCYRVFSQNVCQLFFYETGFLLSSGLCVTDALHVISGFSDRKTALLAVRMLPEIRSGVSFADVFRKAYPKLSDSELQMFLDLSCADGNLAGACSTIWKRLDKQAEERKRLVLRLAEPVLLTGTGICLLLLLEGAVLPFLTQFGGVL